MQRWLVLCALVLASGLATGCSLFMHSIEKPKADVRAVSVTSAGFTGVTGELHLDVTNPNGFGVPLAGIDWQLSIGGSRAVTGSVQLTQTIPVKGVLRFYPDKTVLSAVTTGSPDKIVTWFKKGHAHSAAGMYEIDGAKLRFSTQVGPIEVELDHAGQLGSGGSVLPRALGSL